MTFKPSLYQKNVFDFIQSGSGNAVIEAVAGSGKTTTIIESLSLIPTNKRILMLAFNKSIADELKEKVPFHVEVSTFHSCSFASLRSAKKKIKVKSNKTFNIIKNNFDWEERKVYGAYISKLVSLAKSVGMGVLVDDSYNEWMHIINHHDLLQFSQNSDLNVDTLIDYASQVLRLSNRDRSTIDFDDMLLFTLLYKTQYKKYDFVFIDEAQDTNGVQRTILKKLLKPQGRLIAVGDPYQAIYGFRGADSSAMQMIIDDFGAKRLPLSISYRCAKNIIEEVNKIMPHIEAFEYSPEGSVRHLDFYEPSDFNSEDGIVCRNNAPLISMAYSFIAKSIPVNVLGRDIGAGLITFIKSFKTSSIKELENKMYDWFELQKRKSEETGNESLLDSSSDKYDSVNIFIAQVYGDSVVNLISKIEELFNDEEKNGAITLCTVHKSKGLEWRNVFILDSYRFMPKWARKDWMREQETNIKYVALTRAKRNLAYINLNSWK
jgi:DNA helicase-2/ATP-dependent DNA helicase PcrA